MKNSKFVYFARALLILFAIIDNEPLLAESTKLKITGPIRIVYMDDKHLTPIRVNIAGTVLNFPTRPTKVILGRQKIFDVEYVNNDIALSPLMPGTSSNMYVYVLGQRYGFSLSTALLGGDEIILIRDSSEAPLPAAKR